MLYSNLEDTETCLRSNYKECFIVDQIKNSDELHENKTIRMAHYINKGRHRGLSLMSSVTYLNEELRTEKLKKQSYIGMDASIFYNSDMRLIWSEDSMQKSWMVTRFDQDMFGGKCNFGSSCMAMMLDS